MAPILVHHTRKNTESENSFDRISGTNGLLGAADGAFLLYREKGRVILDQTGKDLPGQRMILDFDPQRCLWTVVSREAEIAEPPEPLLDLIDQVIGGGWQGTATAGAAAPAGPGAPLPGQHADPEAQRPHPPAQGGEGHRILEVPETGEPAAHLPAHGGRGGR